MLIHAERDRQRGVDSNGKLATIGKYKCHRIFTNSNTLYKGITIFAVCTIFTIFTVFTILAIFTICSICSICSIFAVIAIDDGCGRVIREGNDVTIINLLNAFNEKVVFVGSLHSLYRIQSLLQFSNRLF